MNKADGLVPSVFFICSGSRTFPYWGCMLWSI